MKTFQPVYGFAMPRGRLETFHAERRKTRNNSGGHYMYFLASMENGLCSSSMATIARVVAERYPFA